MLKKFTLLLSLLSLFFFPGIVFSQVIKNYTLALSSGDFTPPENIRHLTKSDGAFRQSLFASKHYLTLQFKNLPDESLRKQLHAAGIVLIDYIPNYAYTASVPATFTLESLKEAGVRSVIQFNAKQKTLPSLFKGIIPAHAIRKAEYADLNVVTYEKINRAAITASIHALGATILEDNQIFRTFVIRVPQAAIQSLSALSFVQWVEPIDPPNAIENLPGRTLHRVNILNDGVRNLKGDGINIGIWDGGQVNPNHLDFSPAGRVTAIRAGATVSDHSTHVAGTITGKGLINPVARGMAPNAKLFSWDFQTNVPVEMATEIPARNLLVSNHSYGAQTNPAVGGTPPTCALTDPLGVYSTTSRNTDINLNNNTSHLHVHSSGNSGGFCTGGFMTITGSGKSAKNNLVVSDITTTEAIAGSSSRGPVQDGRIKPEISSMGTNVFSTWIPGNAYELNSGTSMATPGVSGTAALLYQRYKQLNADANPLSALIKNVICNGAEDLGNVGPDYTFGFGRLNALASVKILEANRYEVNSVATGSSNDKVITIPVGTVRLKVMLTWNDPAATANASMALVNDLDLRVTSGSTITLPWIMNKNVPSAIATRGIDTYSNIEQVTIDNPPAGSYTLQVNGTSVPVGANQSYAISWIIDEPYIEVIYPNGGENLNPGTFTGNNIQFITWDNVGVTTPQTVEFSLDNGNTWTTLSTTVPASTKRLAWNPIPAASTSKALVRISSGAVSDISDANFSILGTPSSLILSTGCSSGEIALSWAAVSSATHYDIYRLDVTTGAFVLVAADITATTFTATGLPVGSTIFFAHVAKNNTTGAISSRSNAISTTVAAGFSTIGSITGPVSICGNPSNSIYTVPSITGASYTWTVPPGATIASGQGSNTITVSYVTGSTSGNVTVFASGGACQTATASLPVTVNAVVNVPTGATDQSATVCPPNAVPTLTATVTVPSGHTVTWYDAASGGNIVANPVLSAVGTVTYYAASRNSSSNCESLTRVAIKLTIDAALPAIITASGPTTFCQGGNVTLTANTGTSYAWSNGAITPTIVVSSGGSYSVAVNTGGCILTSAATVVTVNPTPGATITAGGPTTFCEGNNVVLTASTGNSWLWSNGATTQAITVTTGGNYSVKVTNASGCFATSTATAVTVNSRPVATLTAAPYTRLLPGRSTTLTGSVNPAGTYSYTWFKNGTPVPTANAATLPVSLGQQGSYTLTVTNNSNPPCGNTSAAVVIEDSISNRLFVFPNPTDGRFTVSYINNGGNNTRRSVTVYDSKGDKVYFANFTISGNYTLLPINIQPAQKGVFVVVVGDASGKRLAEGKVIVH